MTYKVGQSKPERALSVQNVILSARLSARVRNPDMERIINFIKKVKNVILAWDYYVAESRSLIMTMKNKSGLLNLNSNVHSPS